MKHRISLGIYPVLAALAFSAGCAVPDPAPAESDPANDDADADVAEQEGPRSAMYESIVEAVRQHDQARLAATTDEAIEPAVSRFSQRKLQHGLGIDDTFAVKNVQTGEDGDKHTRLDHFYKGVRVLSSTAVVHSTRDGDTREEDVAAVRRAISIETRPALSSAQVRRVVDGRAERTGRPLIEPRAELVILPIEERFVKETGALVHGDEVGLNAMDVERRVVDYKLVYQVDTLDEGRAVPLASYRYLVDAASGEVVSVKSLSHSDEGFGKSFKNLGPLGGNIVPLDTLKHVTGLQTSFEPFDTFRNFGVWDDDVCDTCGANNDITDNAWGDGKAFTGDASATLANRQTAVVDGLFGMQATWDMERNVFERSGYNGTFYAGHAYVHVSTDWDDAAYNSISGNISVGDSGAANRSSRTTLDMLAHEYGHGLNDFTANLGGNDEGEGLGEAAGDILGEISEAYASSNVFLSNGNFIPVSPGPDWVNRGSGRSFANPNGPRYWTAALAGISDEHIRAMPMDHGFFFLSQGSVNDPASPQFAFDLPWGMAGIGIDKAARIWHLAWTTLFTSSTDYADARVKCISAAGTLFFSGSVEQKAVQNAFAAISVGVRAAGYPGNALTLAESEPNNSEVAADPVTLGTLPAGAPVNGALSKRTIAFGSVTSTDTADFYSVVVPSGKTLRVTLVPSNDADLDVIDGFGGVVPSAKGGVSIDQVKILLPNDGLADAFTIKVKFFATAGSILPAPPYQLFIDTL